MGRTTFFPRNSGMSGSSSQESSPVAAITSLNSSGLSERRYKRGQGFWDGKSRPREKVVG